MSIVTLALTTWIFGSVAIGQFNPQLASIEGRVTGKNGQPLGKTRIKLFRLTNGTPIVSQTGRSAPPTHEGTSGSDGRYTIGNVDLGEYRVTAEVPGYLTQTFAEKYGAGILHITAHQQLTAIDFQLVQTSLVSGVVVTPDGDPIRASVSIVRPTNSFGQPGLARAGLSQTDSSGEFSIDGIPPGEYLLIAFPLGVSPSQEIVSYVPTFYGGTADPSLASKILLSAGSEMKGLVLKLTQSPFVAIQGRVIGNERPQIAMLTPKGALRGFLNWNSRIGSDGSFRILAPPSNYDLVAGALSGRDFRGTVDYRVDSRDKREAILRVTDRFILSMKMALVESSDKGPGQSLKRRDNDADFSGIRVQLFPEDFPQVSMSAFADANGSLTFGPLPAVKYFIDVSEIPGLYLSGVRSATGLLLERKIDLSAGPPAGTLVLEFRGNPGTISGNVQTNNGNKTKSGVVTLVPEPLRPYSPSLYRRAQILNGQFTYANVEPGQYRLYAWVDLPVGEELDPETIRLFKTQSVALTVREGSALAVDVPLIPERAP